MSKGEYMKIEVYKDNEKELEIHGNSKKLKEMLDKINMKMG